MGRTATLLQCAEYIQSHIRLEHLLCALIFLSRLGDIGSTYLITPKLKLEADPIVRKLGWWFAVGTLFVCLIPYYSTALAIIVLVPSLMVSAANASKIWFARAYGESGYIELLLRVARRSRLSHALAPTIVAAIFSAFIGLVLLLLSPDPTRDWGYWFALGFLAYAFIIGFYGSLFFVRLFRKAKRNGEQEDGPAQTAECGLAKQSGNSGVSGGPPWGAESLAGTRMLHLRIVSIAWLALGILGACASLFDLARNIAADAFAGAIESDFIALGFCVAAAFAGYGVFRQRCWARVVCVSVGVVLLLYAMSYFLLVGLDFGMFSFALICAAAVFSVYSIFTTVRYGRAG